MIQNKMGLTIKTIRQMVANEFNKIDAGLCDTSPISETDSAKNAIIGNINIPIPERIMRMKPITNEYTIRKEIHCKNDDNV